MWGFWKGGPAVLSVNLVMGLMGGLAKFSFRALRLPAERGDGHVTTPTRCRTGSMRQRDEGEAGQTSLRGHAASSAAHRAAGQQVAPAHHNQL